MLFQPRQPPFLSVQASCRTDWTWTGSLRRLSSPQALQIWTYWTITSGCPLPCWKSTINSSWSLGQLMSWKSPCRPSGKSCHKNTSTRQWWTSLSSWLPTWLWLRMMVTPSICSLQVCILISSPTNQLFSKPPTLARRCLAVPLGQSVDAKLSVRAHVVFSCEGR